MLRVALGVVIAIALGGCRCDSPIVPIPIEEDAGRPDGGDSGVRDAGPPGPSCADSLTNGAETDVDCGGPICVRCMVGQSCVQPTDCFSGLCVAQRCAPQPTCADGTRNGSESDVDCGGPVCPRCMVGQSCEQTTDCLSALCNTQRCAAQPTCADGTRNGSETDIDCGGAVCPRCVPGRQCLIGADCTTSRCPSGVCVVELSRLPCSSDAECPEGAACTDRVIETDATWRQTTSPATGWEQPTFDDSSWLPAYMMEPWAAPGTWVPPPPMPVGTRANWIWYRDSRFVGDTSTVYFRKAFVSPPGGTTLFVSVDDAWTVYLNGVQVVAGTLWYTTSIVPMVTTPNTPYVLAVRAQNNNGPGGLIADVRAASRWCGIGDAGFVDAGAPGCDAGTVRTVFAEDLALFPGGASAMMALDTTGNVWVAENNPPMGGPRVTQLFPDGGRAVRMNSSNLAGATGLAFDPAGNLYVGDGAANGLAGTVGQDRVMRLTPAGVVSVFAQVTNPTGIAIDSQSRVYVASWTDKAIYRFEPDGGALGQFGPTMLERPAGLAFSPSDNLYVGAMGALAPLVSAYGQKVYEIDPMGQLRIYGNPGIVDAFVPAVDPTGAVWSSYYNGLKLVRFEADGGYDIFPGGWTGDDAANGIAFNPAGDLFVVVNGGRTTSTAAVLKITGAAHMCR